MRTPAPTGLGHRTWFVKTGVGAHSVRPYMWYTDIIERHGGICRSGPAQGPSSFGGKSGDAGRAAADVYSMAIDGGMLSGYLLLCESHRRRVRSAKQKLRTSLPKWRRVLGFLGGSE